MEHEQEKWEKKEPSKWTIWLCSLLATALVSLLSYTALLYHSLDVRVSIIEGNRWTSEKGSELWAAIAEINKSQAITAIILQELTKDSEENRRRIRDVERQTDRTPN